MKTPPHSHSSSPSSISFVFCVTGLLRSLTKVVLTLAMLNFVMHASARARDFASHALLALQGKEDSEVAPQILTFLKLIETDP